MRAEQELDLLNVEALITMDGAQDDVLGQTLKLWPSSQRAPIVAALVRWREVRKGLDDEYFPTVRALQKRVRGGGRDAAVLRQLLQAWGCDVADDEGLDDDTDDDGLDDDDDEGLGDDTDDECLDDDDNAEGLDDDDAEMSAQIDHDIQDELRRFAALGLSPLQWIGAFTLAVDYTVEAPLFWSTGGLQRLEALQRMRRFIDETSPDALLCWGADTMIAGGHLMPTVDDAQRWATAWEALRPHELAADAGHSPDRRAFFDSFKTEGDSVAGYAAFCKLLGAWSAEIATAYALWVETMRPNAPTLAQWLARADAAQMVADLVRVRHDHPVARITTFTPWSKWAQFLGFAWASRDGLPWAAAPSLKGGA